MWTSAPDTTEAQWVSATSAAPWSARRNHAVFELNSRLWVAGGESCTGTRLSDVWFSTIGGTTADGSQWTQGKDLPGPLSEGAAVVFGGSVYLLGGIDKNGAVVNSVVSSSGNNWQSHNAPWSGKLSVLTLALVVIL